MHLSHSNLERFVPDIKEYEPQKLWDAIVAHFAAKTVENSANALDKLFETQFNEGDMKKSYQLRQKIPRSRSGGVCSKATPSFLCRLLPTSICHLIIFDSGASSHFLRNRAYFHTLTPTSLFWASNHSHCLGSPKALPSLLFPKTVELAHISNTLSPTGLFSTSNGWWFEV
ncbi:uncharacterized protein VP01_950g1 [Puccinia sorghi]|uniref:Uncharacterized protein n=1 Tax=Puccinia sorghi TaxID=27349 RepID=A0A0L6U8H7_9BASI|nr:uncharacterized protein VP01_950g1 [Puccinia sorghi]